MADRHLLLLTSALVVALGLPLACAPQVVDAVNTKQGTEVGGTSGAAGASGTAGAGTGGSGVGGTSGGAGPECPDGGSEGDLDRDGFLDCNDGCPEDPNKDVPGTCGCGLPNPSPDGGPSCADLIALLAHRYTFEGPADSNVVVDSQAGMMFDGEVQNTTLSGNGTLVLAGARSDQWVGLHNGLLQESPSITLEAWVRWNGGNNWQRIFDFGFNNGPQGEGYQGPNGTSYLFLTARTPNDPVAVQLLQTGKLRLVYRRAAGELELIAEAATPLPSGGTAFIHVAAVVDSENKTMSLYMNGLPANGAAFVSGFIDTVRPAGTIEPIVVNTAGPYDWGTPLDSLDGGTPPPVELGTIDDRNNWLGRSQYQDDDDFGGTYEEFRIYAGALTAEQIQISFAAGPNPVFFN
jgi:hypothetical protein